MLRKGDISTEWTPGLAYVIGLITSDGNLSKDGRHIIITSKDVEILNITKQILKIENKIGIKARTKESEKKYFVLQFGSVHFYHFLEEIGLSPAKSKIIKSISIPDHFFLHFLRGCFDGDGNINESKHPESIQTQLKFRICSGSKEFLLWLHLKIRTLFHLNGGSISTCQRCFLLSFGKSDSIIILNGIYEDSQNYYLSRKYQVAHKYLST